MENRKLNIQWFIEQHNDWEKVLSSPPYSIRISRDTVFGRNLVMLKYVQFNDPDFSIPTVRECRGIILDEDTLEVVSYGFNKFGNYGESYVPDINWKNCHTTTKIDGSLIKVSKVGDDFLVSTNGTIDAFKAELTSNLGCKFRTYGELFKYAVNHITEKSFNDLFEDGYTYMFELVSPYNRIVVPYKDTNVYLIGIRNNRTFEETFFMEHPLSDIFPTPDVVDLSSLDDCLGATKDMPWDEEGYVVVDDKFNRVKIKSPAYVSVHHLRGDDGTLSLKRGFEVIKNNEIDEICTYFEEYRKPLNILKDLLESKIRENEVIWSDFLKISASLETRKEKAEWILSHFKVGGIGFALLDKKTASVSEWFYNLIPDKLIDVLDAKNVLKNTDSF